MTDDGSMSIDVGNTRRSAAFVGVGSVMSEWSYCIHLFYAYVLRAVLLLQA